MFVVGTFGNLLQICWNNLQQFVHLDLHCISGQSSEWGPSQQLLKRVQHARKHCGLHGPLWAAVRVGAGSALWYLVSFGQVHGASRPIPTFKRLTPYSYIVLCTMGVLYTFSEKKPSGSCKNVLPVILHCWKGTTLNLTLTYAAQQWHYWDC